jgi:hypothetical protein
LFFRGNSFVALLLLRSSLVVAASDDDEGGEGSADLMAGKTDDGGCIKADETLSKQMVNKVFLIILIVGN